MNLFKNFKVVFLVVISSILCSCGNLLSDEELETRYEKAMDRKDWSSAKSLIDERIIRNPETIDLYFGRAWLATNVSPLDIDGIISDLSTYINKKPENAVAIMFRFQAYLQASNYEKALEDINTVISKKGRTPYVLSWKGNCAFLAKKFDVAAKVYEQRTRMQGSYEDIRNTYYYMIFSKYLAGNKEGAMWDCGFLKSRGFEEDDELMKQLIDGDIKYEALARFELPKLTINQLEEVLRINCPDLDLFPDKRYMRPGIMNELAREPRTTNLKELLPKRHEVYVLNLDGNNYKTLPKELVQFKNLQALDLSGSQFTDLEKTIEDLSKMPNLIILQLNRCGIKELPANISLLSNLVILDVSGNRLKTLPASIGKLTNLKFLSLQTNLKLTELPKSIGNLQCLQVLDVSQTRLTSLPVELGYCLQLVSLSANRCRLKTLPETIGNLLNLKYLSVIYNKLEKLPQSIGNLESLTSIRLVENKLTGLPKTFVNLDNLGSADLEGNKFKTFPKELLALKSIYSIWIHRNEFTKIPLEVAKMETLQRILVNPKKISQKNIDALKAINSELYVIPQD